MKAITVKQPWASLIVHGIKDIENRTWPTKYRGRVLIHAGQYKDSARGLSQFLNQEQFEVCNTIRDYSGAPADLQKCSIHEPLYPKGAIIGSVEIVDCVINHESIWAEKTEIPAGTYMGEQIIYNWVLANPILFENPIENVKGKLSFWNYNDIIPEI